MSSEINVNVQDDGSVNIELPDDLLLIIEFMETVVTMSPTDKPGECRVCSDYGSHSSLRPDQIRVHIDAYQTELGTVIPYLSAFQSKLTGGFFSPSMIRRGWKFWKTPVITGEDSNTVDLASRNSYETLHHSMLKFIAYAESGVFSIESMNAAAESVSVAYSSLEKFAADLREIL